MAHSALLRCDAGHCRAARLRARLGAPVAAGGLDGDAIEAQAMAFIAARRLAGLPSTFPETTGCRAPIVAGTLLRP